MMDIRHFANLHGRARTRKAVLILERIEREWRSMDSPSYERSLVYARGLAEFMAISDESPEEVVLAAQNFLSSKADLQAINRFRHALMAASGQRPADWDFVAEPRPPLSRATSRPGMRVYLEDIRSPFNVGSVFRTAEALGFEEIILSPECADPLHPRALRTSMGTVERLPWRRAPTSELAAMEGVFALEVGGIALQEFDFPLPGIMVVGSEELGISRETLGFCRRGCAEIPLVGTKASLNVATAFGIAGFAWLSFRGLLS